MEDVKVLKGDLAFSVSPNEIETYSQSFIVIKNGVVEAIYHELPEKYNGIHVKDFGNKLIIPGFVDMHVHGPQYFQRGLGMDMELLQWLETYTFREESNFSDLDYAKKVYSQFADELVRQGTLCTSVFATIHKPATEFLFEALTDKGIYAYVGKVNMDRNCPDELKEETNSSLIKTEELLQKYQSNSRVKPILTPRFVPTCSCELLTGLGELAQKYNVPVQSHLSENRREIEWVHELHPDLPNYSSVYEKYGLFGKTPTLMAHCIYNLEEELAIMSANDVIAVHCPDSNLNLSSGIMPVRKILKSGVKVALGSDVGGGHNLSMARAVVRAIQESKIMKLLEPENEPLSMEEAFYMVTKGGGSFFGKVGSFEPGYSFVAIVIDDSNLGKDCLTLRERLQRFIYIGDDRNITARLVDGKEI